MMVEERLDIVNFCFKCSIPATAIASGTAMGGLVTAEAFGGTGALIIAGTAFPPVTPIIGACMLGGVSAGTAVLLVKKFWVRHQLKALNYLNQIFEKCLSVLEEIAPQIAKQRSRIIQENIYHMIACITYYMSQYLQQNDEIKLSSLDNIRSIVNKLYYSIPIVPTGELIQDLINKGNLSSQDIDVRIILIRRLIMINDIFYY